MNKSKQTIDVIMGKCKDCKSWKPCSTDHYPYSDRFGKCETFYQRICSVGMDKGFKINFVYIEVMEDDWAFEVYVGANFGCIQFEKIET